MSDPAATQDEIVASFAFFQDWAERYQYLIDLGRRLPPLPERFQTDGYLVSGCQSRVWLAGEGNARCLHFHAASDSAIVAGLVALLLRVYSGRSAAEIRDTEPEFVERIGLQSHLSPTRTNGLYAVLARIKGLAAEALEQG